jgi:hypothetical protein
VSLYTASELAALRECQESFMDDACQIGTLSASQDSIGDLVDADCPAYAAEQACGLQMLSGSTSSRAEFRTADGTVAFADAKLRIAHDAAVSITSVVKITKRHGTAITPIVYEVLGVPAIGASGTVCFLRQVTT